MEKWVQMNTQVQTKDKIARLIQYASRAISDSLERKDMSPALSDSFKTLEYILSTFRKLLRLGKSLDLFYSALKSVHYPDVVIRVTLTIGKLSQSLFLFADHFMWLARTGLVKDINIKRWSDLANRYWLLSIIMNLSRDVYEIMRLINIRKSSIKSGITRSLQIDSFKELSRLSLHLYALLFAHKDIVVDTIKNSCDCFIPLNALGYTKLTNRTVGILGTISSLAGLIAIIDPLAKLVPM